MRSIAMPETRTSLLVRLHNHADKDAWEEFFKRYGPVIFGWGRRMRLQDADAENLTQEVLSRVVQSLGTYRREAGPFKNWLFVISRNEIRKLWQRTAKRREVSGGTTVQNMLSAQADSAEQPLFDEEMLQVALARVRSQCRPKTWAAFEQTSLKGLPIRQVARELGMTEGNVYVVRSRIVHQLRQEIKRLEDGE